MVRNSFVACLLLSSLACAQAEERISDSYTSCLDKDGGVTPSMQDFSRKSLSVKTAGSTQPTGR